MGGGGGPENGPPDAEVANSGLECFCVGWVGVGSPGLAWGGDGERRGWGSSGVMEGGGVVVRGLKGEDRI